ncbi:hypothetical protein AWV79_22425 [Cupriavidus sp. UYMMa02A]|nr:hypothetical protein AWV79_22425 [Cupriavidus sp. UYMMa02A]
MELLTLLKRTIFAHRRDSIRAILACLVFNDACSANGGHTALSCLTRSARASQKRREFLLQVATPSDCAHCFRSSVPTCLVPARQEVIHGSEGGLHRQWGVPCDALSHGHRQFQGPAWGGKLVHQAKRVGAIGWHRLAAQHQFASNIGREKSQCAKQCATSRKYAAHDFRQSKAGIGGSHDQVASERDFHAAA